MEEKIKRESKQFVEKLFKKYDTLGSGAISKQDMERIIVQLLHPEPYDQQELHRQMENFIKDAKYTTLDKQSNKFELMNQKASLDFPSAMTIAVRMLLKSEFYKNQFSDTGLVQLRHFEPPAPKSQRNSSASSEITEKRKIF